MTNIENDSAASNPETTGSNKGNAEISSRFNTLVKQARASLFIERLWPKTVPPFCAGSLFLSSVWLGMWTPLPAGAKMAGVLTLAAAALASPLLVRNGSLRVAREDAVRRLDGNLGNPKALPARNLDDKVNENLPDLQRALHDKQVGKLWSEWGDKLTPGKPAFNAPGHGRYKAAFAAALCLTMASGFIAGDHRTELLTDAFNWKAPAPVVLPLKVVAWVKAPENIDGDLYLTNSTRDHTQGGQKLVTSQYSTMTIQVYDRQTKVTVNGKELPIQETLLSNSGEQSKTIYQYETPLMDENTTIAIDGGPVWHLEVRPDRAPTVDIKDVVPNKENPKTLNITFGTSDDHGVESGEITIEPAGKQDLDARPLPSSQLPKMPLP